MTFLTPMGLYHAVQLALKQAAEATIDNDSSDAASRSLVSTKASSPAQASQNSSSTATTSPVPVLLVDVVEGLWFLKHSTRDNNTDVTCFKGALALLEHWCRPALSDTERGFYVAQAEVSRPMLLSGHKMMVRAYMLVLAGGQCFIHRELLLKGHPEQYDPTDPDPLRHVVSCVKYDRVTSALGSSWPHYAEAWPQIRKLMAACMSAADILGEDEDGGWVDWISNAVASRIRRLSGSTSEAGALQYEFYGADIIVDQDLRPWIIELNPAPTIEEEQRDPLATTLRANVIEDLCALLVDPVLRAALAASASQTGDSKWAVYDGSCAGKTAHNGRCGSLRGFVEL